MITNDKILITGTPRTGTTFLIQLYHELGYKTGFPPEFHARIQHKDHQTHGGIELGRDDLQKAVDAENVDVVKHPWTMGENPPWRNNLVGRTYFKHVIVTNRRTEESLRSMERREKVKSYGRGIRWDKLTAPRKDFYIRANLRLREHYPGAIEVKFPLSVLDLGYLYGILKPTLSESISNTTFELAWRNIARSEYVRRTDVS